MVDILWVDDIDNGSGDIRLNSLLGGRPCELLDLLVPSIADLGGFMAEATQLAEQANVRLISARRGCQALGCLDEKDAHLLHRERITVERVQMESVSVAADEVSDGNEETRVV